MKIFKFEYKIDESMIDLNHHANNVKYVEIMQKVAILHSTSVGDTPEFQAKFNAIWVIKKHEIEYLAQGFLGDEIEITTFTQSFKKTCGFREYEFKRKSDNAILVKAKTLFVLLDNKTFRPKLITKDFSQKYI